MGSWVLFKFAWPCLALGYPLFASIRAIETKSNYHCKKLVTYWILFSLISLFEHAFFNQPHRISVWYFTKLAIVSWLVIPSFNGAVSIYKLIVQSCINVDLHDAINWFMRQKNSLRRRHNFLDELDKYINDNGTEALEKLLANKLMSKVLKPCLVEEETKVAAFEDEELKMTKFCRSPEESNAAAENSDVMIKYPQHGVLPLPDIKVTEKIEATKAKPVITYTRKKMFELKEIMETSTEACRSDPPIVPAAFRKEWSCAICQVTTTSGITSNLHLKGRRHCEHQKSSTVIKRQNMLSPVETETKLSYGRVWRQRMLN